MPWLFLLICSFFLISSYSQHRLDTGLEQSQMFTEISPCRGVFCLLQDGKHISCRFFAVGEFYGNKTIVNLWMPRRSFEEKHFFLLNVRHLRGRSHCFSAQSTLLDVYRWNQQNRHQLPLLFSSHPTWRDSHYPAQHLSLRN